MSRGYGVMEASLQLRRYHFMKYKHMYMGAVEKVRMEQGGSR